MSLYPLLHNTKRVHKNTPVKLDTFKTIMGISLTRCERRHKATAIKPMASSESNHIELDTYSGEQEFLRGILGGSEITQQFLVAYFVIAQDYLTLLTPDPQK